MSREKVTQAAIRSMARHPYLWALGLCLFIDPFFLGATENIPNNALWLEAFLVLGLIGALGWCEYKSRGLSKRRAAVFTSLLALAGFTGLRLYSQSQNKALWHFAGGIGAIILLYRLLYSKKYRAQLNSLLIMGFGFCLKLYYVLVTSVGTRQHDVHSFDGISGHAGYIEYLLNNRHLTDFDVRRRWQYCHPPLHHAISALWIYINEDLLLTGHHPARESLQTLTLFYSVCTVISAYRIFRHFGLEGKALYVPLIIISFHPAFILFSGSINNDPLAAALVMGAVVCTLKWCREHSLKNILKIALCVGLAMMTKISAATVAPPIALVFLIVFIKNFKAEGKGLLGQFAAFGAVCVPLGLWFGIRNYVKWKVPLTYVAAMDENAVQYLGDRGFASRALDFSLYQFSSPYEQWAQRDDSGVITGYNEFNPLTALMKNSIFGEYINESCFGADSYVNAAATVFFWVNVLLGAAAFILMIALSFKKCSAGPVEKLFFAGFYIMMTASFYKTAADYPYTCTMNFRYITPTAVLGCAYLGLGLKAAKPNGAGKALNTALNVCAVLFALCSGVVYASLK